MRNLPTIVISTAFITAALLWVSAGTALAQIAAPRLNATQVESSFPYNPAVLPWSGSTRIALGILNGEVTQTALGTTVPVASGSGTVLQMRLLGESISIQAENLSLSMDVDPLVGAGTVDVKNSLVAISYQLGGYLGFGIGFQSDEFDNAGISQKESLPSLGLTLRLGEVFYLGAATGKMTDKRENALIPLSGETERTITRYGVAVRWRQGPEGLHLEVYKESRSDTTAPIPPESQETSGATVEAVLFDLVFAFEALSTDVLVPLTGSLLREKNESIASIGWMPEDGFSLTAGVSRIEETLQPAGNVNLIEITFVNLGWQF